MLYFNKTSFFFNFFFIYKLFITILDLVYIYIDGDDVLWIEEYIFMVHILLPA